MRNAVSEQKMAQSSEYQVPIALCKEKLDFWGFEGDAVCWYNC